ncbi:putative zinc-binding oxidoreductase [Fusarium oxysporum f. sp. albedinis]|nr:putative zinc-binding oxidoreductase [Fusarium oxysporum f. sp. albedinis]
MVLLGARLDGAVSVLLTALASFDGLGYGVEAELSQSFTCPKQVLDAGVPWTVSHFTGPKLLTGPEKLPLLPTLELLAGPRPS